ncbi:CU044_2847 family protein [Desulfobacterales bacterium HSG16]|nr:CU044_2847 family protein [Desulfobacterales bacterium HSG16]
MNSVKKLIEFELEDGTPVYIEVEDPKAGQGTQLVSRGGKGIEKSENKFTEAVKKIKPAAEAVLDTFRDMNTPDEIGLEFGLKFNAKAGAIIASVDSEATFKVSLKWINEKNKKNEPEMQENGQRSLSGELLADKGE